ncbi:MAG: 23S rRNA (adenine(2503)-C(2))-methyltransferase RlmN [Candidatus Shapirobacteria bacterium]|nr:23S rRNA (adenine(2503)-C(2))-methyltransferase RlmN [Candidatus Shapirobacteria bacterium]MDD4410626.1 23S rRNA (adenine(2503)-C(2))-methyltransferase RlmN [Candidatus Shapirobacteria bacterium]
MDLSLLKKTLDSLELPAFRYRQIVKNYYSGRYLNFDQMTDLSLPLRQKLSETLSLLSVSEKTIVGNESTQKALLELSDGQKIESVFMDYEDWLTACVSSQVGCPLACSFCATGKMGFKRNLTPEEIVDQILYWNQKIYPKYIGRVVFMGMGEPFLNWENILTAINIINSNEGLNIGARKISVSTAGVADKIIEFANLDTQINLAVSLHSADQKTRESFMPIAKQYSLAQLKNACNYYVGKTNRQLFFEYALMDINTSQNDAILLANFINSNRLFFLNLIPLNSVDGGMTPASPDQQKTFIDYLNKLGVEYSLRRSFGQDISAACGQLATV